MNELISIAVVGDYNTAFHSHPATTQAIHIAAEEAGIPTSVEWVHTTTVPRSAPERALSTYDGVWAAPASPYQSFDGMLAAIRYARERGVPFLGT